MLGTQRGYGQPYGSRSKIHSVWPESWNKKILNLMTSGDVKGLYAALPGFATQGKADMGFKHAAWVLGAIGGKFKSANVRAYGPLYGSGGAVVEFILK